MRPRTPGRWRRWPKCGLLRGKRKHRPCGVQMDDQDRSETVILSEAKDLFFPPPVTCRPFAALRTTNPLFPPGMDVMNG